MKRLLLLLLCAVPLSARVLSYSPYTDALSGRGDQLRTTRHFVLVEMNVYDRWTREGQVVLYDSKGIDAPRVIFPRGRIYAAALYQDADHLPPTILVCTTSGTHISNSGGRSWRRIKELDGLWPHTPTDVDYGGPWTHGLASSVRIGTKSFPFVVSYEGGVYAIAMSGPPRLLATTIRTGKNALIGQNREGTEFVILTGRHTFAAVSLDGRSRPLGRPMEDMDAAWITPDGSVYAVDHIDYGDVYHYRTLYLYRNRRAQLVLEQDHGATFAVIPTHDFRGAWISEAGRGHTALRRHQPGGELEMMWEIWDDDSPRIEALHAGAAGDTLLIQVHRPRATQTQFIDPALALWRVDDGPPAAYDELFLREGPDKGFVHVDVDTMAAGDPFVFDSSFNTPPPPEPVSAPIGGGGDVMQEWGVVRASLVQRLVLPGATRTPGEFLTDLTIYNPLNEPQDVAITFAGKTKTVTIDANEIRVFCDALGTLFDVQDAAGTLLLAPKIGINAIARVYTLRDGGSRGYTIGAIDFFNVASPRFPVTFAGAFPGSGFRTQLLLTDTSGGGLKTDVMTTSAIGVSDTSTVEARSVRHETMSSPVTGGLIVRPTSGMGIAGVVVVDERSGDPTYFPPDIPSSVARPIPFVAHVEEEDGTILRSDLHLLNYSSVARPVMIEVKPYNTNQWSRQVAYSLRPYESKIIEDPLKTVFNLTGIARLRYSSWGSAPGDSSGVRVTSRIYRTRPDGGTSGTLLPPMNSFQAVTGGESLEILVPIRDAGVALGLIETSPFPRGAATNVRVTVYDERSRLLHQFDTTLPMAGGVLTEDLFATMNIAAPVAARIVVQSLDNNGMVSAYALLTDRITRDMSYLGANLSAKE